MSTGESPSRDPVIRQGQPRDAAALTALAERTFRATNEATSPADRIEAYIASHFRPDLQEAELRDPARSCFVADTGIALVGYALLRAAAPARLVTGHRPVELGRIYVDASHLGSGSGSRLMERCIKEAVDRSADVLWLAVWQRNERALEFYGRWGFNRIGEAEFDLGGEIQHDFILARGLS